MNIVVLLLISVLLLYIVRVLEQAHAAIARAKGLPFRPLPVLLYPGALLVLALSGWWSMQEPEQPAIPGPVVSAVPAAADSLWHAPDTLTWQGLPNVEQLRYGRDLIANTSHYFGPKGVLAQITNGMNCQNCHLDAGAKPFGNNYSAVYSTYPKFRERSGTTESISKRVNDCMERSLNGRAIDSTGTAMQAIVAYIRWLGQDVEKGAKPKGSGLQELAFLERAADPKKGALTYAAKCQSCHGSEGQGVPNAEQTGYTYPPLWGEHSYNSGAGLYRLSRFAGYIHANMPLGASHDNPQLSEEEAWDLAAFVNSQPRPKKDLSKDWPNIAGKPIDHPFGPYSDGFTEQQHKYGPFGPIKKARGAQPVAKTKAIASR
jgi:thiosulfate dehydrogenase